MSIVHFNAYCYECNTSLIIDSSKVDKSKFIIKIKCLKCFKIFDYGLPLNNIDISKYCIICNKECDYDLMLINGSRYHHLCYDSINDKYKFDLSLYLQNTFKRKQLANELEKYKSIVNKIYRLIKNDPKVDIQDLKIKINELDNTILILNKNINQYKQILFEIHSFWPSYPPDWEDRKKIIQDRTNKCCEVCGIDRRELHLHHKIPMHKGGNHTLSNLEYVCVNCHSRKHGGRTISVENNITIEEEFTGFYKKLELIQYAIDHKKIVRFKYRKYDGEKSVRSISPEYLKQAGKSLCVGGYCYLRNENRIFAIKRMTRLKIEKSSGINEAHQKIRQ